MDLSLDALLRKMLKTNLNSHEPDGLYEASMDHSPSEQITPQLDWHTTALIVSRTISHQSNLAKEIAKTLRPKTHVLVKWKNATKAYKKGFKELFFSLISKEILVFAISAHKNEIIKSVDFLLRELEATEIYNVEANGTKRTVKFGPFYKKGENDQKQFLSLSENRAIMALFISHFVCRMHRRMWETTHKPYDSHLNWNFMADKFPGTQDDGMAKMFSILIQRDREQTGRILCGYFGDSDTIDTDLLADNVAGLLSETLKTNKEISNNLKPNSGIFWWEQWHPNQSHN